MKEELIEIAIKLEVLSDSITGILDLYDKIEEYFNEPTDSTKIKVFIKQANIELLTLVDSLRMIIKKIN